MRGAKLPGTPEFDSSEPAATDFSYGVPLLGGLLAAPPAGRRRAPHPSTVGKPPIGGLWGPASEPTLESSMVARALTVALGLMVALSADAAADPVIMAAGDIACDPDDPGYNDGAGTADRCHQQATSDLLLAGPLDAVLPLGDIQYDSSTTARINAVYAPTWGRVKSISRPILGNHEGSSGSGYFDYFNGVGAADGPAGPRGKGYYSYDLGAWHLVALNSNCSAVSCSAGSEQETWLRADLAAHPANCTLAYWHHPRWSSGHDGSNDFMQPLWEALQDAHAEILLSGHSHDYERFAPLDRDGEVDQAEGIRQFVVGTGGAFFTGGLGTRSRTARSPRTTRSASSSSRFTTPATTGRSFPTWAAASSIPARRPATTWSFPPPPAPPPGWHRPGDLEAPARATPGPAKEHVPVSALGGGHGRVHDQAQGQESLSHGGQVHPVRRRGREREALPRQDPQQAPAPGDLQDAAARQRRGREPLRRKGIAFRVVRRRR